MAAQTLRVVTSSRRGLTEGPTSRHAYTDGTGTGSGRKAMRNPDDLQQLGLGREYYQERMSGTRPAGCGRESFVRWNWRSDGGKIEGLERRRDWN